MRADTTEMKDCLAIMWSKSMHGHLHTCLGSHEEPDFHFCPGCKRWWWHK